MIFGREPVAVATMVRLVLVVLVVFKVIDEVQFAAVYAAVESGLFLYTRNAVTPVVDPKVPVNVHVERY